MPACELTDVVLVLVLVLVLREEEGQRPVEEWEDWLYESWNAFLECPEVYLDAHVWPFGCLRAQLRDSSSQVAERWVDWVWLGHGHLRAGQRDLWRGLWGLGWWYLDLET